MQIKLGNDQCHKSKMLSKASYFVACWLFFSGTADAAGDKTFDIRFSPMALFIQAVDVEANFKITDKMTLGPMLTRWDFNDVFQSDSNQISYDVLGLRGYYHFNGAFKSGAYLSPLFRVLRLTLKDVSTQQELSVNQFGITGGYLWQGDTINFSLGIGISANSANKIEIKSSTGNVSATGDASLFVNGALIDFALGFAF